MKSSPKITLIATILVMLLGIASTASAQQPSIVDIINSDGRMTTFKNAMNQANLPWLASAGPFTVVVPSESAFAELPEQARNELFANPNELRKLVLYHIVQGAFDTNQLMSKASVKTSAGQSIKVGFWNGKIYLNDSATIAEGDKIASNGAVHLLDKVLLPPNSDLERAVKAATNGEAGVEGEAVAEPGQPLPGTPPLPVAYYKLTDPTQNSAYVSGGIRPYWSGVYSSGGCRGMTWVTHQLENGHTKIGADRYTNAWRGDTTCHEALPMICILKNGAQPPASTNTANYRDHWSEGAVRATGHILGTELTSEERANEICAGIFGEGWQMAEFHDAVTGSGRGDGWYFWAQGGIPAGIRFWVSIFDQPANPWDSVIARTPPGPIAYGGSYFEDPAESNPKFEGWRRLNQNEGFSHGRGFCKGTTWVLLRQFTNGLAQVGGDTGTNPYVGDRACEEHYPILCINVLGYGTPPPSNGYDYSYNWSGGAIQRTPAEYSGHDIGSRRDANRLCKAHFGNGYRMATHHDGALGTNGNGGWEFWGFAGGLHSGLRYWVAVNDQNSNPWNPWGY